MSNKALEMALAAVEANHKWHQEYAEFGEYEDSNLCDQNVAAIRELKHALRDATWRQPPEATVTWLVVVSTIGALLLVACLVLALVGTTPWHG